MTAEEIRALYVETLANAMGQQETGNDWRRHGGEEVLERANLYVDALDDAGLLPTPESSDVALELTRTAEKLIRLAEDVTRGNAEHVTKVDRLHNEIEEAHRRWWHPLFGLKWETTGMSTRRSRSRWNL